MLPKQKNRSLLLLFLFLLLAGLLSACQSGPTDQVQACNPKSLPVVKTLQPVQALSQTVYATSGPNLYALNAGNGATSWCSKISTASDRDELASVTHDGDKLYAFTEMGNITSFAANSGKLVWSVNTENIYSDLDNAALPPSIANETIYGGTRSIYALNTQDGSVRWQYALPDNFFANTVPLANNGKVYVGVVFSPPLNSSDEQPDQLIALDAATGNKLWTFSLRPGPNLDAKRKKFLRGDLTVGDGVVVLRYEGTGLDGAPSEGLNIVDAQNGKLLWQKDLDTFTSMSVANGLLYVSGAIPSNRVDAVDGFYAFDIRTGALRWSLTENMDSVDQMNVFIVANNTLYTTIKRGEISAIDALTGQLLWRTQFETSSEPVLLVRLILLDQELFVGTEVFSNTSPNQNKFFLHALNTSTRQENWYADITGAETPNVTGIDLGT